MPRKKTDEPRYHGVMTRRNTTTLTKAMPIVAPLYTWKMLSALLVVVNYDLLKRGEKMLNMSKLIGTILTHYVASTHQELQEEFLRVQHEAHTQQLPFFYDSAQLDAITSAAPAQVPDLLRIGWARGSGWFRTAAGKALRNIGRRPECPTAKSAALPSEVRKRRGGASAETHQWVQQALDALR